MENILTPPQSTCFRHMPHSWIARQARIVLSVHTRMSQIEIRAFQPSDEDSVIELWREVFPNEPEWNEPVAMIRRKLLVQRESFLVALRGYVVVGTVLGGYDGVRGWIYHLAVHPSIRRAGVARRLMMAMEQQLIALGCPKINLQVRAANTEVVAFYKAIGYDIENRINMGKRLVSSG